MKFLIVGDPHVVVDEIAECQRLADRIFDILAHQTDAALVILGDLYNNHAAIRLEVMDFWHRFFSKLSASGRSCYALVGNHDLPQSGMQGNANALMAHVGQQGVCVVSKPLLIDGIGFIPYQPTVLDFENALEELGRPAVVFAHQTFQGCQYENGFFAPDGVPTSSLAGVQVISGHIHSPQQVGPVWYPGAPRWRSIVDANVDRFLYLVEVSQGGYRVIKRFPTDDVCVPIRIETIQSMEEAVSIQNSPGLRVTIQGDESFINEAEKLMQLKNIKFRSVLHTVRESIGQVQESAGISVAFKSYWESFTPPHRTPKEVLEKTVSARLAW